MYQYIYKDEGNIKRYRDILVDLHSTSIIRTLALRVAAVVVANVGGLLEPIKTFRAFLRRIILVDDEDGKYCCQIFRQRMFLGI